MEFEFEGIKRTVDDLEGSILGSVLQSLRDEDSDAEVNVVQRLGLNFIEPWSI